jgi:CheY-like chemotaxis protein
MTDELLSLRIVVVSNSPEDHDLIRRAATSTTVPVEVFSVGDTTEESGGLVPGADILYLDGGFAPSKIKLILAATRAARSRPFSVMLTAGASGAEAFEADALADKPARLSDARRLIERSIRVRLPSRVLIVDDSATMRTIVRKLLAGTRFPIEVREADEGFAALQQVREAAIDLVFVDYNMPGFSGLETIAELKREKRRVDVVLMTSVTDETLPDRAREHGAAFLRKPFYLADIEAVLCRFYGLRALNPKRA